MMRRAWLLAAASALLAGQASLAQSGLEAPRAGHGPLKVGSAIAPDVALQDIQGKTHRLGDYRGKVVFLHFWSIVCPYERLAEPKMIALQKEFAPKGVVQLAINANEGEITPASSVSGKPYAALLEHVHKSGVNFPVLVDHGQKVADMLGARSTPHCYVLDRKGVIRYAGALDDDPRGRKGEGAKQYVRNAIEALLAGRSVPVATSKPYG